MQQQEVQLHNLRFDSFEDLVPWVSINSEVDENARDKEKISIITLLSRTAVARYWTPSSVIWSLTRLSSVSVYK